MKLYIMRHGETDANRQRILQGHIDNPLNKNGQKQASQVGAELCKITFGEIFSSPLMRAKETGELATGVSLTDFVIDDRLIEISFGELEGMCIDDIPEKIKDFFRNPSAYQPPEGGESFDELIERVKSFLDEIKGKYPDQYVLVVSHGAAIHAMMHVIRGLTIEEFWSDPVGNCAIIEVSDESGEYTIVKGSTTADQFYTE